MSKYLCFAVLWYVFIARAASSQPRAELQYLQHSGWVVRTPTHILVFDYIEATPSGAQLPDSLKLTADSFGKRRVVVFVSHSHQDHLSPVVATWARTRSDIIYVAGSSGIVLPGGKLLKPRETWTSGAMTVRTTGSTDEGVGFAVTVDGMTFYHAGDHARWVDELDRDFMSELRWLQSNVPAIDIAFFPIATGMTCEPRAAIALGVRAAAHLLQPRVLIPMHVGCADRLDVYERFRREAGPDAGSVQIIAPTHLGSRFRYSSGTISIGGGR